MRCSDDENHGKTKIISRGDAKKHKDSNLDNNHGTNSQVENPTGSDHPATKKPRLSSVVTEPPRSTLCNAVENTDRVLKKVRLDVDNSEPMAQVSETKRTGYLRKLSKADLLFLSKVEHRKRRLGSSSEELSTGNSALVAKKMQSDMDNSEPMGLVPGSRRNGEKLTESQLSHLF